MNLDFLPEFLEDESIDPNEKVEHLLTALAKNQIEMLEKAAPFKAIIEAEQAKMAKVVTGYEMSEAMLKQGIWFLLEDYYPDERHDGEAGTAQIIRQARIVYDTKALEALRESSDANDRLLSPFREERTSKPYLKVKLK